MSAVRVAFDIGPLRVPPTGVGRAVRAFHDGLSERPDVDLVPYLLSFRARELGTARRLPLPAAMAHRLWGSMDRPTADRWLGPAVDLIHGTNYVVPPSSLPRLVSVYDMWFVQHPDSASPGLRRVADVLRRSVERGAHVHACSEATAQAVLSCFPEAQVHTVPLAALALAADADADPLPQIGGRPYVLFTGTLERRKNLPRLIAAFAAFAEEHPDHMLVLAGAHGDDHAAIERALLALPVSVAQRVSLTGRIDDNALARLIRRADVLAYPSLDEGFGFPLLDAMQAGVPIVASTAGSIPEVAGAAALLCGPDDVDQLAAHLTTAVDDEQVRRRLVAASADQLAKFSWSACTDGLAEIYRRIA